MKSLHFTVQKPEKDDKYMTTSPGITKRLIHNIPYAATILLGAVVIYFSIEDSFLKLLLSGAFILYGILSTLWFMMFLCVHCQSYGSQKCRSGFGLLASKLRARGDPTLFRKKFKGAASRWIFNWISGQARNDRSVEQKLGVE